MSELDFNIIKTTEQPIKTNSDIEENNDNNISDNDDEFVDYIRFTSEDENIDLFSKYSDQDFNACPMFFMGSLKDACQAAFGPTAIEERRSILVYIYHNDSQSKKKFFESIFYSSTIINYLNINYIVWPYEITFESNRFTLTKIWEEIFSTQFFDDFSIEECPLLIGIMRLYEHKIDEIGTCEYQFKTLVKDNILTSTEIPINCENLWNELEIFKDECEKNQQILLSNFIRETNLSWEIILDIAQYLSLNDAISTFSINIYPLLNKIQSKFQLSNPCDSFIKIILSKIKSQQIVSLKFNTSQLWSKTELKFLSNFKEVISLTLYNVLHPDQISQYKQCFPNLIRLCLYYDNYTDYYILSDILNQLQRQIRRLEIHYPGVFFTDKDIERLVRKYRAATRVEYLLLNVNYYPLTSTNNHLQKCKSGFQMSIAELMKHMSDIRYIHIISNSYNIEYFLDDYQWNLVLDNCRRLKKIRVQVLGNASLNRQFLMKKAQEIQRILRNKQQAIEYQISVL